MEEMMEREWKGHRLFCGCTDDLYTDGRHRKVKIRFPDGYETCPECQRFPWYYPNPADEPRA